jgi:pimeloyl-ACP methyl ester carboxylesterase
MAITASQESTNVRLTRQGVRWLERLSPVLVGRLAFTLFATPGPGRRSSWQHPPDRLAWLRWRRWKLATYVWEASGPTVLLVHGWAGSARDLEDVAVSLREAGYRVVAFDAPGHGRSTGRRVTLPLFADALEAVARSQPELRAIVAHSFGGVATVVALSRGLPCTRAVLLASPSEMEPYLARMDAALGLGAPGRAALRARVAQVLARAGLSGFDLPALTRRLSQAALIIHDASDREVPPAAARRLARGWSGAERVETEGLGHRRLMRNSDVVARVTAFVAATPESDAVPESAPPLLTAASAR